MLSIIFMIVARIKHCKLFFLFSADNFHDHFTYLTLWAVFLFSADFGNATVSTNSKQVGLRHSRGVNMFYFSGLSFRDTRGSEFFGSAAAGVWVSRRPQKTSVTDVIILQALRSLVGLSANFAEKQHCRPFVRGSGTIIGDCVSVCSVVLLILCPLSVILQKGRG